MKLRLIIASASTLLFSISTNAQDTQEAIVEEACNCIAKVDLSLERTKRYKEVKTCISSAILMEQMMNTLGTSLAQAVDSLDQGSSSSDKDSTAVDYTDNVIVLDKDYEVIEEDLLRNCDAMQAVMTTDEVTSSVSVSDKKKAKKFYDEGLVFFKKEAYEMAIGKFEKALKKDSQFAFAWDMLGYSYRKLEKYEKAIECYNASIKVDPKGRMPLTNKPIAYALMGDNKNAIKGYEHFISVFPDDAEGYYGVGRIYHLEGDYEKALDNTMKAFLMYQEIKSPYARDAEYNLSLFYNELKEKDALDVFHKMAKKHNITID